MYIKTLMGYPCMLTRMAEKKAMEKTEWCKTTQVPLRACVAVQGECCFGQAFGNVDQHIDSGFRISTSKYDTFIPNKSIDFPEKHMLEYS